MSSFNLDRHFDSLKKLSYDRAVPDQASLESIAMRAADGEIDLLQINQLINAIWLESEQFEPIKKSVIAIANALRKVRLNGYLVGMTPIEIGNQCASNCDFCGWRADNQLMQRMSVSPETIIAEVEYFIKKGIYEIELVCGDHMPTIQGILPELITEVRGKLDSAGGGKIHLCTAALTQSHYEKFRDIGADAVITWQETYDPQVYNKHISKGPKARGITPTGRLKRNGDGYNFRLSSQDRAAKAGLNVAIGSMLGLNDNTNFEVLATIMHARYLIETYDFKGNNPLIIGMPTWNTIPTPKTDNRPKMSIDIEEIFSYIAAVYFLSLPRENAWVFPNCRVSLETQIESIRAGGMFTSTSVKVGAGGNLPEILQSKLESNDYGGAQYIMNLIARELKSDNLANTNLTNLSSEELQSLITDLSNKFDAYEQFNHHYHRHEEYEEAFKKSGYALVRREDVQQDTSSFETLDAISKFKMAESIKNSTSPISVKKTAYSY